MNCAESSATTPSSPATTSCASTSATATRWRRARRKSSCCPHSTAAVSRILELLQREKVAFVPRGAGTGLSGGCLPLAAPVMVCTSRMRRIVGIDFANRRATVEAGVVNLAVTNAVKERGLYYAPDPSSQMACTIGGNVAENSGGPHTLKYGVTTNHVLGLEMVLPSGEVVELGGAVEDVPGYDLVGLAVGSEGTFGIVTQAMLRLSRQPESWKTLLAIFESVEDATQTVSGIIAAGIVPAALEMMDRLIVEAVEAAYHFGFPTDAGAVLIIELDGLAAGLDRLARRVTEVCRANRAREVSVAKDEAERAALWKSRKRAFGAVGRLAPSYCTQDGVVPRTKLPDILRSIGAIGERYQLRIANVFHAGDGNIHPILLYDERNDDEVRRVLAAGREILRGLRRSRRQRHRRARHRRGEDAADALAVQPHRSAGDAAAAPGVRSRAALQPGKIFPTPGVCVETTRPKRRAAL